MDFDDEGVYASDEDDKDLEMGSASEDLATEDGEDGGMDGKDDEGEDPHALRRTQPPAGLGPLSMAAARNDELILAGEEASLLEVEVAELLAEALVQRVKGSPLQGVINALREALLAMPEHEVPWSMAAGFVSALGLPLEEDKLAVRPPRKVTVVGSYAMRTLARPETTVDLALELPEGLLAPKAHLNHRYHARRALWLAAVARHLRDTSYSLFGQQVLSALRGDPRRPALLLRPAKAEGFVLRLIPTLPAKGVFALPRLAPDRNGVRAHTKPRPAAAVATATSSPAAAGGAADALLLPTPYYNNSIVEDMVPELHAAKVQQVLAASPRLGDALVLLKLWARRQGLLAAGCCSTDDHGGEPPAPADGLDGTLLAFLVLLLAERNKLAASMSSLQAFRAALQLLADSAAWSRGLALACHAKELGLPPPPPMASFKSGHALVLLDHTGWLNVAAHLSKGALAHAQARARAALGLLSGGKGPGGYGEPEEVLSALFLARHGAEPATAFDYHWRVALAPPSEAEAACLCKDRVLWREQEQRVEALIQRALSDRAKAVRVLARPVAAGCTPADLALGLPPLATHVVWVGGQLDPLLALRLADVGPPADDAAAAARFRRFWGDKSELRRWQDGKISETVVWEVGQHERHTIPDLIVRHALSRHLPAGTAVAGAAGALDWALARRGAAPGVDVAAQRAAEASLERLGKQLRALDGLALKVVGVAGLSAVARGTAPFPPQPHPLAGGGGGGAATKGASVARCVDAMEVLVTMENSGRWPDDPVAFRKMKAALGVQLAGALVKGYGLAAIASEEAVDVLVDGFAFRLVLYSGRDEAMLARASAAAAAPGSSAQPQLDGSQVATSIDPITGRPAGQDGDPESSPLQLSWHHGLVSSLAGTNAAYAPSVRLAQRWVGAHMMSNHCGPHMVELLVAAAFLGSGSTAGPAPGSRMTGLLRFLELLAGWPWQLRPLLLDPTQELGEADRRQLRQRFDARRADGSAPAMYLCTPRDRNASSWPQQRPSAEVLQRLSALAAASAAHLRSLLQGLPPSGALIAAEREEQTRLASAAAADAPGTGPATNKKQKKAKQGGPRQQDMDAAAGAVGLQLPPPLLRHELAAAGDAVMAIKAADSATQPGASPAAAAVWHELFTPRLEDFDALLLLRKEALPHADLALPPATAAARSAAAAASTCASGLHALSPFLEGGDLAAFREPPPKRARAFLRVFPEQLVASKGLERLQPELLVGFDPLEPLLAALVLHFGHLAMFCVDALGGQVLGVKWRAEAFLPQAGSGGLRPETAHTALVCMVTGAEAAEEKGRGGKRSLPVAVPNVFVVFAEMRRLGLGMVDGVVHPRSSAQLSGR